ncbi:hypothetical protein O1Q96_16170 [Streptomyces sp. Qhu-G9]|uniref:hypothetical protein n=1 Tax=Streptomyces sp. Qhu-G9 TaxID=3452799 RepID=UPI0022AC0AD6|nr:hypothetical protein [Streptomyces aurantiacus]WAU81177.1 hypothetical protein O1Q96_16170 [Streptomyces aurantiacus]
MMQIARAKGYRWISLGDDANLFAHVATAGLREFKVGMGFHCVPSQDFHDPKGIDEADLIFDLARFTDPVGILGYASSDPEDRSLHAHVQSDRPTDLQVFQLPFLAPPTLMGAALGSYKISLCVDRPRVVIDGLSGDSPGVGDEKDAFAE